MASRIIADKFMESSIWAELAILTEKMSTRRILEDKIPKSYQNPFHFSESIIPVKENHLSNDIPLLRIAL